MYKDNCKKQAVKVICAFHLWFLILLCFPLLRFQSTHSFNSFVINWRSIDLSFAGRRWLWRTFRSWFLPGQPRPVWVNHVQSVFDGGSVARCDQLGGKRLVGEGRHRTRRRGRRAATAKPRVSCRQRRAFWRRRYEGNSEDTEEVDRLIVVDSGQRVETWRTDIKLRRLCTPHLRRVHAGTSRPLTSQCWNYEPCNIFTCNLRCTSFYHPHMPINNTIRYDTVDLRALKSWRDGQLNLAHGPDMKNNEKNKNQNRVAQKKRWSGGKVWIYRLLFVFVCLYGYGFSRPG